MNQPLLQMDLRLVGAAIVVLAAAVIAIWLVGRRLRGDLGPLRSSGASPLAPGPTVPPQVAKELQARGLVTSAQLANMTEMERQLLFSTVAATIAREGEGDDAFRTTGARAAIRPEDIPTLFCPMCGYHIERFGSAPPVTGQCETCGAKVVVRRDAPRLLLTVLPKDDSTGRRAPLRLE
ncbi:MAG: hypothetical protein Q8K55_07175 [Gemmatimonadaceae bacterium]|nr:hypothetical protein [Gemmatimonadaceae bacterium]